MHTYWYLYTNVKIFLSYSYFLEQNIINSSYSLGNNIAINLHQNIKHQNCFHTTVYQCVGFTITLTGTLTN